MDDIGIGQAFETALNIYLGLSLVFIVLGSIGLFKLVGSKSSVLAAVLAVVLADLLQCLVPFVLLPMISLYTFPVSLLLTLSYAIFGVTAFFLSRRAP
jgi:hypothetical protein